MNFSEREYAARGDVELPTHDDTSEVDLFLENCSSLYGLILDAIHDLHSKTLTWSSLEKMTSGVVDVGQRVAADHPEAERTISLRINTINSAMEQLKLRRHTTSDTESCSSRSQCSGEVRSWIHVMEKMLKENEERLRRSSTHAQLASLMADQHVLQKEIQTEGQALVNRLFFQLSLEEDPDASEKKKSTVEAIRKRWHTVYLNSLSLQFRIEDALNSYQEDSDSDADSELLAPPAKRRRRHTFDEDTLPFAESEYESIMDGRATVLSLSSEEPPAVVGRKWDSQQQDIGYSSGENSGHDTQSADFIPTIEPDHTPLRSLYRVVLDDVNDMEIHKTLDIKAENPLSDSMHVQYDHDSFALPDFDEVMALLDNDHVVPLRASNESFNTQWREIRAGAQTVRRARADALGDEEAKNSCDASSEDSSDWEGSAIENKDIMSRSFHSSMLGSTQSLKRHRSGRKSFQALETSEMDASFCSTRSDMRPTVGRSIRKRIRVRRMPRSMSDGEQLGVKAGYATPAITVSPPKTPLSASTRLLQQLDKDLCESHSDTAPEQSDAPVYEWDEYNPPAKDDSLVLERSTMATVDVHLADEDYDDAIGAGANQHLIYDSTIQYRMVSKFLESSDIICDSSGGLDYKLAVDIALICSRNVKQLEQAANWRPASSNIGEVTELKEKWDKIMRQVLHPPTRKLYQLTEFVKEFRALHERILSTELCLAKPQSIDDIRSVMETLMKIEKQLTAKQVVLRDFLQADDLCVELAETYCEFESILKDYDDDIRKLHNIIDIVRLLYDEWKQFDELERSIRFNICAIEQQLIAENSANSAEIADRIAFCEQDVMRLETASKGLTDRIRNVDEGFVPNFDCEIKVFFSALENLKSRLNDELQANSTQSTPPPISTTSIQTQTPSLAPVVKVERSNGLGSSFLFKSVSIALCLLCAFIAIVFSGVLNQRFGPHVSYVNGPPPI